MVKLITGDIHQTDNVRDEYRWRLFPWMLEQVTEHSVDQVIILGDLTDAKDKHSAKLVNRFAEGIAAVAEKADVYILKGNHDFIDAEWPFFQFLENTQHVKFITEPTVVKLTGARCLFLPSTKKWETEWADIDFSIYEYVFTHETFDGCLSESGMEMRGIPPSVLKDAKQVLSGDIHVPQKIGKNIEYLGAPYRLRFGDKFEPRVMLIDDAGKRKNLHVDCISKHTILVRGVDDLLSAKKRHGIQSKDQVKIRVQLKPSEYPTWQNLKAELRDAAEKKFGWDVYGPELVPLMERQLREVDDANVSTRKSNLEVIEDYGGRLRLDPGLVDVGVALMEQAVGLED